jgi:hypothetical protein
MEPTITKAQLLDELQQENAQFETILMSIGPARMTQPDVAGGWSIKDIVAHLTTWRSRTVARFRAARSGEPVIPPPWPPELQTDDEINAWIYAANRDRPLGDVLDDSRIVFQQLVDAIGAFDEAELRDISRFTWLEGQRFQGVTFFGHFHEEHESDMRTWLERDGRADFDFFIGTWKVHHRRLKERLTESQDWEEFEGKSIARKILGGLGNIDEMTLDRPTGQVQGMTLRLFNPQTQQWSLYWAESVHGTLQIPMVGEFKDGRGEFYDQEPFAGKAIFSRFIWSEITPTSCRWAQAFSADGGRTWETNWIMDFTRAE